MIYQTLKNNIDRALKWQSKPVIEVVKMQIHRSFEFEEITQDEYNTLIELLKNE